MRIGTDILENEIVNLYPDALEILLRDHTTQNNIFWATDNYEHLGLAYAYNKPIKSDLITGDNGDVIMPRVHKDEVLQRARSKEMAEVFTPSWVCNSQNNMIDDAWFGQKEIFNREISNFDGLKSWETNHDKIKYPKGKTWEHYVRDTRLEVACGEAPYITSRYDSTIGKSIPVELRIGILDRKLRVINENVKSTGEWLKAAQMAYKHTYAFEWQGDNLLLAREAMLASFIENYSYKFGREPLLKSIQHIAYIISWNVWQMDGLKGVIPNTCGDKMEVSTNLFGETETKQTPCEGCEKENIKKHNGIYCVVKDWSNKDLKTRQIGRELRFIDLINGKRK